MKIVKITLLLIIAALGANAQSNLTLYNMEPIPQRLLVNPALTPDCKSFFGTPLASSYDFHFNSNAFDLDKIDNSFIQDPATGEYTLDIATLVQSVDKQTFVNFGFNQEWLTFGKRIRKSMFTFGITEKIKTRLGMPNDLLQLVTEGNGGQNLNRSFNFNFGLDLLHTREFAVGYSRTFLDDRLSIGGRVKFIQGLNSISTKKSDIIFTTNGNDLAYTLEADIDINASTPALDPFLSPTKIVLGNFKNRGLGIDLGASLDINKRITVSASVIDLGVVKWVDNTKNIKSRNPGASFTYRGIDLKQYVGDSTSGGEGFEVLADSLLDIFALDTTSNSFTTGLLGEFYLGGNLRLNDRHNAGALIYGSFYKKQFYPALTLSWNSELGRLLAVSVSYTMMRGNFANIGFGSALNLGPEQFYIVSDNLIGATTGNVKNLSFRFGWNHTMGRKSMDKRAKKKRKKDKQNKKEKA